MKDLDDLKALYEAGTQGLLFIHDFRGASDKPSVHDITISCDHPATITVAYMGNALTATPEEALANAKKFVALHNSAPALFAVVGAAAEVVTEQKRIHDESPWPQKYRAAFGAIAKLSTALAALEK